MKNIHFKLVIFLLFLVQGCATNDVNSPLVRWWSDGFIYSEKKGEANSFCSDEANKAFPNLSPGDAFWESIYGKCMKKKGY